jgi:glycosyltransferase involved in cell wall biosynthesis
MSVFANRQMHIMHVITGLDVGGAELALLRLIGQGTTSMARHTVVSLLPGGSLGPRFEAAQVSVRWLDFRRRPLGSFLSLCRHLRAARPDIVHTWMYHADLAGGLAARLCGIRRVIWGVRQTLTSSTVTRTSQRMLYRLCAVLSGSIPQVIVCCAHAARQSHVAFGYAPEKMQVIQNGFDTDTLSRSRHDRDALRHSFGIDAAEVVVGHVARYSPEKDHLTFLGAARRALDRQPGMRFMMLGRGIDSGNLEIVERIRSLGIEHAVLLLGERDDVPHCLCAMDIFCLSSRFEGFPNVLGEAMAMGVPSVTTDAGDARAIAGSAASVVACGDTLALSDALVELATLSADKRTAIGAHARERITSDFSLASMRSRFDKLYKNIASDKD